MDHEFADFINGLDDKRKKNIFEQMKQWAINNNLEKQFNDQISANEFLNIYDSEALIKVFGYFVLKNSIIPNFSDKNN